MNPLVLRADQLPTDWTVAADPFRGTQFQAVGPSEPGQFRASLSLSEPTYTSASPNGDGDAEAPLDVVHDRQLESAFLQLTDAVLIDHRPTTVSGHEALVSTIAFRQGLWTLTSMVWTIAIPDGPIVIVGSCDADRFDAEAPIFERLVDALPLATPEAR